MLQDNQWLEYFRAQGHAPTPLGRGMEGVVYDLGAGLVGKVWFQRHVADLRLTREFQRELAAQHLPFATPCITDITEVAGRAVTIENRLPGTPLRPLVEEEQIPLDSAYEATLTAVTALSKTEAGPAAHALPVLDESAALWAGHDTWAGALSALVQRRVASHGTVLRSRISKFDGKLARILRLLEDVPTAYQIVHGDICRENILVDADFRISALLDWSFLTTAGDNTFEAAVAAGVFDMYGPQARASDDALTRRLTTDFGHSPDLILLYRAAYSVITANAYSADGSDGNFAWCAASLERDDVAELLL